MKNTLKIVREAKNLNQVKVARDLNISQETMSSYETGRIYPSPDMLIKLAKYYDISIEYILGRTDCNIPIDKIKPSNIDEKDFLLLNKINKLSSLNKAKTEGYIDGLNS